MNLNNFNSFKSILYKNPVATVTMFSSMTIRRDLGNNVGDLIGPDPDLDPHFFGGSGSGPGKNMRIHADLKH